MFSKVKDLTFSIVLIFVIAVGIYWLMVELQKDYLDHYLSLLGDKLIDLVPESSEKRSLQALFNDFKQQVEEQAVTPEQVEKVAAGILNISNLRDSISVAEARAVLEFGEIEPLSALPEKGIRLPVNPEQPGERDLQVRWKELGERLEAIYKIDQHIRNAPDSIRLDFRFDQNLNIVIDDRVKEFLEQEKNEQMTIELQRLEEEKALIWKVNVGKQMENVRLRLRDIRQKKLEAIDSLAILIHKMNDDSINVIMERDIEKRQPADRVH